LQVISSMAVVRKVPEIDAVAKDLARIMRYSIPTENAMVTVKDEVDNVSSYLKIQGTRFRDTFSYSLNVDDELLDCKIAKLVLQPIVENSVVHGFRMKDSDARIDINVERTAEGVAFVVTDNGCGLDEQEQAQITSQICVAAGHDDHSIAADTRAHLGLRNINRRIKVLFGESYGIVLASRSGAWTQVTLTIPEIHTGTMVPE